LGGIGSDPGKERKEESGRIKRTEGGGEREHHGRKGRIRVHQITVAYLR